MKNGFLTWFVAAFLLLPLLGQSAVAEMLTIPFRYEFSDAFSPEGDRPWVTATFDDEDTVGSVKLELDLSNLVEGEYIGKALFNLDPALDPTSLVFGPPAKIGSFADPVIGVGIDTFRAAGQWFDLQFEFTSSNANDNDPEGRFGVEDSMIIEITAPDLKARSFDFSSNTEYGPGPLAGAIHVKSIGAKEESGWVADRSLLPMPSVPEPAMIVHLLSVAGLGLIAFGWRQYGHRA